MNSYQIKKYLGEFLSIFTIIALFFVLVFFLSLIIYLSINNEWQIASYYSHSQIDFYLSTFPYLFLIPTFLSFFVAIIIYFFSESKNDFSVYKFSIVFFVGAFALATILFYLGIAQKFVDRVEDQYYYNKAIEKRFLLWNNPEFGFLSGRIGIIHDINDFLLYGLDENTWTIRMDKKNIEDPELIQTGTDVRLIGRIADDGVFEAEEIFVN